VSLAERLATIEEERAMPVTRLAEA
jgi:hypothetical protein